MAATIYYTKEGLMCSILNIEVEYDRELMQRNSCDKVDRLVKENKMMEQEAINLKRILNGTVEDLRIGISILENL